MINIVEICCGSYYDALQANLGNAKRIELNSALHLGGLTPSLGTLKLVKHHCPNLEVVCMVRPRGAGFNYSQADFEVMVEDAKLLMQHGADGLVFGILDETGNIDLKRNQILVDICKQYNGTAVFHRAFDCVKDPFQAMESLIDLGVDRVLTSGLETKAQKGQALIKELQLKYGKDIEILVGSGINATNAKAIIDYTGVHQVHSSCKKWQVDNTTSLNNVSYSYCDEHENEFDVVSKDLVGELVESVK